MKKVTETQAAYIAGFFDGEGHVSSSRGRTRIGLSQKNSRALRYLQQILGVGYVYKSRKWDHRYRIYVKEEVLAFIQLVQPYCIVKKEKLRIGYRLALLTQKPGTNRLTSTSYQLRFRLAKQLRDIPNG